MEAYSRLLKEKYSFSGGDPSIVFESGIEYTLDELSIMDKPSNDEKVQIHFLKQIFEGEVVHKQSENKIVNVSMPNKPKKYPAPKFYTLGNLDADNAYQWTQKNLDIINMIVSALESCSVDVKKTAILDYIELRKHFMFDVWIAFFSSFDEQRKKEGKPTLTTLLVLAEIEIGKQVINEQK
jgi:hypothetical protein